MSSGIYKWTNLKTGRVLVGQAVSFIKRKSNYLSDLRLNKYDNKHFQNSWNKYGEENFIFEILEIIPEENLQILEHSNLLTVAEQYWVDFYRSTENGVFNEIGPVNSPRRGTKHTLETREKISKKLLGKVAWNKGKQMSKEARRNNSLAKLGKSTGPCSEDTKKKISQSHFGLKHTEETRQKLSDLNKGKKLSDEVKIKISEKMKGQVRSAEYRKNISEAKKGDKNPIFGKVLSQETRGKISAATKGKPGYNHKPVIGINLKNNEEIYFKSQSEVAKSGFAKSSVSKCCAGHQANHRGYFWRYATVQEIESFSNGEKL